MSNADGAAALLVRRAQQLGVPLGVHIDVTYRCDLACVHCYLTDRRRDELTLDEYTALFDDLRALGTLYLLISGGEIFRRPDGEAIVEAAAKRRFDVRLITHGGHIDEPRAARLAAMGVRVVAMSIYSDEPTIHDAVTGVPGSWERTTAAARHLRAHGVPVTFKFVVMRHNVSAAPRMAAFAQSVGALLETSVDIKGDNRGSDALMDLNIDADERRAAFGCVYPQLADRDTLPVFSPDAHTCMAGNASCYISPDGTVQPCLEWEEKAGSIREQRFGDIWRDSPVFRGARTIRRSSFEGCASCANVSHCSLCPARALRETGSATGSAPSKCRETGHRVDAFVANQSAAFVANQSAAFVANQSDAFVANSGAAE